MRTILAAILFCSVFTLSFAQPSITPSRPGKAQPIAQGRDLSSTPLVAPDEGLCRALDALIEDGLKTIALETSGGSLDDSAPRESNRQLRSIAAHMQVQIQLTQMQMLRCAPPVRVLDPKAFNDQAIGCAISQRTSVKTAERCDKSLWQREPQSVVKVPK